MFSSGVIQGCFPDGLPRFDAQNAPLQLKAAPQSWVQAAIARTAPVQAARPQQHASPVQRLANGNAVAVPPHVHLPSAGGRPIPPHVLQRMEAVFGARFGDVRVHVGPHASALGALAFTRGSDIHFAPGQYDPASPRGQQLLAHELTHVVQQRSGRVRNPFGAGLAVVHDAALESEAERMRMRVALQPHVVQRSGPSSSMKLDGEKNSEDHDERDSAKEQKELIGWDSSEIYRWMPDWEWNETNEQKAPAASGHFWSPTRAYVQSYMGGGGKGSSSSKLVRIQLKCTYRAFLTEAANKGQLHAQNFGSAERWKKEFPGTTRGKKEKSAILVKNDGGTVTIMFLQVGTDIPAYLKDKMRDPEIA
jgi:hypothetical protein